MCREMVLEDIKAVKNDLQVQKNNMKKIFLAGHKGMVGSSILKQLKKIKNVKIFTASRAKLNLCNQYEVERYFKKINLMKFI